MIALTLFGKPATVNGGVWDLSDPLDQKALVDSALAVHLVPGAYYPDVDAANVDALEAAYGDAVRIVRADKPGDVEDLRQVIY